MSVTITDQHLDQAITTIDDFSDSQITKYFEKISQKQPALFGYVLAMTGDGDESVFEDVLYTCSSIYKAYELALQSIPEISEDTVIRIEENFSDENNPLNAPGNFQNLSELFDLVGLKQETVLNFIIEVMLSERSEQDLLQSEDLALGMMTTFIFAKSLDETINGGNLKIIS